ncbi:hypothetical protein APUTEX25_001664 [Auxenochlorella protothecoides]|uniref:Uncharacterized protein n=1 Tax=Auxenochlorella protothecoides TaxID=3075 RepID=A0A3M7KR12_AUXPR|nr:hypothetical protein APUTEX25_001664 [Auxenochlorella protothecoides]|eukprot:RMZ52274.1 hypothetical protein APUTEX25_001664 [Auxenochlorella protothecoides]
MADGPTTPVATRDSLWSLQYMLPGPITACAGSWTPAGGPGSTPGAPALRGAPFQHGVMSRFADPQRRASYLSHPRFASVLEGGGGAPGLAATAPTLCAWTLTFDTRVPRDLETLFRRGEEWEAGVELVLGFALPQGAGGGHGAAVAATDLLSGVADLAESSVYGAVQSVQSVGPVRHRAHDPEQLRSGPAGGGAGELAPAAILPDVVFITRFPEEEQLEGFLCSEAMQALMGQSPDLPLRALWAGVLHVGQSQTSRSNRLGGGLR